jgi:hypothetical protein
VPGHGSTRSVQPVGPGLLGGPRSPRVEFWQGEGHPRLALACRLVTSCEGDTRAPLPIDCSEMPWLSRDAAAREPLSVPKTAFSSPLRLKRRHTATDDPSSSNK